MPTYADNPGNLKPSRWRILCHEPVWPLALIVSTVGLFTLARLDDNLIYALGGVIGFAVFWIYIVFYLIARVRQFRHGDINISKIISLSPPLFATSTNMRKQLGGAEYPVVKIVRRRVPNARGLRWKAGDYFAAACLYSGGRQAHWDDFDPLPLSMAIDRVEVLMGETDRLAYGIPELELRLSLVRNVRKPGLYFLDSEQLALLRSEGRYR